MRNGNETMDFARILDALTLYFLTLGITFRYFGGNRLHNRSKEGIILKGLICTNIMQRGVGNVNPMKMAKCIMGLERIYRVRRGSAGNNLHENNLDGISQSDLANQLGVN